MEIIEQGLSKNQSPKYTTDGFSIINRESGKPIPQDEPILILRAQDRYAADNINYMINCADRGSDHEAVLKERLKHFQKFRDDHPERMKEPDSSLSVIENLNAK